MIGMRPELVEKFIRKSLTALRLDHLDLYLVHAPVGLIGSNDLDVFPRNPDGTVVLDMSTDLVKVWKAMEDMVDAGLTKSIGVSNFNEDQIKRILKAGRIKPANLQIELHAEMQQKPMLDFCHQNGITVCAYAPLGSPGRSAFYAKMGRR